MEHESIIRKFFRYRKKLKPQNQKISKKDNNIQTIALKSETEKEKYWKKRNDQCCKNTQFNRDGYLQRTEVNRKCERRIVKDAGSRF